MRGRVISKRPSTRPLTPAPRSMAWTWKSIWISADSPSSATALSGGLYEQTLAGSGTFTVNDFSINETFGASLQGGVIYATPDASAAAIQLDVTNFSNIGGGPSGFPSSGYLVLQGPTSTPVSLATTNPGCSPAVASSRISIRSSSTGRPPTRRRPTRPRAAPSPSPRPGRCWPWASLGLASRRGGRGGAGAATWSARCTRAPTILASPLREGN